MAAMAVEAAAEAVICSHDPQEPLRQHTARKGGSF